MIRMNRPHSDAPAVWKTRALEETRKAIAAYKQAVSLMKEKGLSELDYSFDFEVYGDDLLRSALNKVYRYKCAYCETFFGATQPVAVEHYRPKGEVIEKERRIKPGYYWLAATWDNLLPSCTDCNSRRRQEAEEGGGTRVRGKGNYFPLATGSRRAKAPGGERREQPLLLHPEKDDPKEHLEFLTTPEQLGLVRPRLINGIPSEKGRESIEVYALDRPQLNEARRYMAKRMVSHLRNTRLTLRLHRANPMDAQALAAFTENIADLREMIAESRPYVAMMRTILEAEFPEHTGFIELASQSAK